MQRPYHIGNHKVIFSTGTAIAPVSGRRVGALAAYDENLRNWKMTTDTDWLPYDDDEAEDMLENYDWETSREIAAFWPDD